MKYIDTVFVPRKGDKVAKFLEFFRRHILGKDADLLTPFYHWLRFKKNKEQEINGRPLTFLALTIDNAGSFYLNYIDGGRVVRDEFSADNAFLAHFKAANEGNVYLTALKG